MSKATRIKIEKLSMLVKVECMIMRSNVRERQKYNNERQEYDDESQK